MKTDDGIDRATTLQISEDDGGEEAIERASVLLGGALSKEQLRRFQKLNAALHEALRKDPQLLERLSREGVAGLAAAGVAVDKDLERAAAALRQTTRENAPINPETTAVSIAFVGREGNQPSRG